MANLSNHSKILTRQYFKNKSRQASAGLQSSRTSPSSFDSWPKEAQMWPEKVLSLPWRLHLQQSIGIFYILEHIIIENHVDNIFFLQMYKIRRQGRPFWSQNFPRILDFTVSNGPSRWSNVPPTIPDLMKKSFLKSKKSSRWNVLKRSYFKVVVISSVSPWKTIKFFGKYFIAFSSIINTLNQRECLQRTSLWKIILIYHHFDFLRSSLAGLRGLYTLVVRRLPQGYG